MQNFLSVSQTLAAIAFILSLGGLSQHVTAKRGNLFGIIGMVVAVVAILIAVSDLNWLVIASATVAAAAIGLTVAKRVQMTAMPELVAILHSFVGLAAVLVAFSLYVNPTAAAHGVIHAVEIYIGAFVGAVTFTGSLVAYGKLSGKLSGKPLILPARHWLNGTMAAVSLGLIYPFVTAHAVDQGLVPLVVMTVIAFVMGYHLVAAIGGADMPVVVSMLNSYSGWAAAASGFSLGNDLLIITGALVGSSGAILSLIMCRAMNRSLPSVIFGGFGATAGAAPAAAGGEAQPTQALTANEVADLLKDAKDVIIVPGYGMAVAQAQYPTKGLCENLQARGCRVRFAIHPVAGRLPGHMNVLLAEANLPYDIVLEMDEINDDFKHCDVVIVAGANDIVNPGALDDKTSPIFGMPVLHCWNAKKVIILKRSTAAGYSGIDNPLFYKPNSYMYFGDAKKSIEALQNLTK